MEFIVVDDTVKLKPDYATEAEIPDKTRHPTL
jgi:hypothetical protein